jgi:hypothetical protein
MSTAASRIDRAVQLRQASFADYAQIVALEAAGGLKSRGADEWIQLWRGNPAYEPIAADWPIGWVLENNEGKIVGSIGNLPLAYSFNGRSVLVATGRGWSVDPRYRSYALLLMDQYFSQTRVDIFLNTTVNALASEGFGLFGSARVPVGDWSSAAFWITRYRGFAESALKTKRVPLAHLSSYAAAPVLYLKDRITAKPLPAADNGIRVEVAEEFDERFDDFWETLSRNSPLLLGVRSREVLNWHFGYGLREGKLRILTIAGGSRLRAYGILRRQDHPQSGLTRMRLVDYQALDNDRGLLAAILRRAIEECRDLGVHSLEHVGCDLEKTRLIDELAPYRRKLPAWSSFYRAGNPALERALSDPAAWSPSSYDGDSSL